MSLGGLVLVGEASAIGEAQRDGPACARAPSKKPWYMRMGLGFFVALIIVIAFLVGRESLPHRTPRNAQRVGEWESALKTVGIAVSAGQEEYPTVTIPAAHWRVALTTGRYVSGGVTTTLMTSSTHAGTSCRT